MTNHQIADLATSAAQIADILEPNYDRLNDAQATLLRWARATEKAGQAFLSGTPEALAYVIETSQKFEAALAEIN